MKRNYLIICLMIFGTFFSSNNFAVDTKTYTTPPQFMNLYFNFTGEGEADFPKDKITISRELIHSEVKKLNNIYNGPLVMFINSSFYIYDQNRKLVYSKLLRTNRSSCFFEMTAVSHIGPALSYLAKTKQNGDPAWKKGMADLLENIKSVKAFNAQKENNWLDRANIKAWQPHKQQIRAMIDYAMSMSGNYILSVQNGASFDLDSLQDNFLNGNEKYPISYNSVMVATFMLTAMQSMTEIHDGIAPLNLDWPNAMVIVRNTPGSRASAALTAGTNWVVPLLNALADNQIPRDRILVVPYAQVPSDVGQDPLSLKTYQYYAYKLWGNIYSNSKIAQSIFADLDTIYLPDRPAIPGDYNYSKASDINDFMVRLKYSLLDPREMLSNTVGYWMPGEMQNKKWDVTKIDIPGLTTGFPPGISKYPDQNPPIAQ